MLFSALIMNNIWESRQYPFYWHYFMRGEEIDWDFQNTDKWRQWIVRQLGMPEEWGMPPVVAAPAAVPTDEPIVPGTPQQGRESRARTESQQMPRERAETAAEHAVAPEPMAGESLIVSYSQPSSPAAPGMHVELTAVV